MPMVETIIRLAEIPVRFICFSEGTIKYLRRYLPEDAMEESEAALTVDSRNLVLDQAVMAEILQKPYYEYYHLISLASDALMKAGRCCFHGTVFIWKEKAWILTAPSGTGKSTQYKNLSELYGQEVFCLNGDKPALEFSDEGKIMVHDSPWRGKEGWGTKGASYPLAGMFYLKQEDHNEILEFAPGEEVVPVYGQFYSARRTEDVLRHIARMEDRMLKSVPLRLFKNRGDLDSTKLLYHTIRQLSS